MDKEVTQNVKTNWVIKLLQSHQQITINNSSPSGIWGPRMQREIACDGKVVGNKWNMARKEECMQNKWQVTREQSVIPKQWEQTKIWNRTVRRTRIYLKAPPTKRKSQSTTVLAINKKWDARGQQWEVHEASSGVIQHLRLQNWRKCKVSTNQMPS